MKHLQGLPFTSFLFNKHFSTHVLTYTFIRDQGCGFPLFKNNFINPFRRDSGTGVKAVKLRLLDFVSHFLENKTRKGPPLHLRRFQKTRHKSIPSPMQNGSYMHNYECKMQVSKWWSFIGLGIIGPGAGGVSDVYGFAGFKEAYRQD